MTKGDQLEKIAQEIATCKFCQENSIGLPVPGEGSPDAKIIFVGEAPGKKEAETGRPFVGRSGQLLRQAIKEIGLSDKDIFITSVCKYLPASGTPSLKRISHGKIHVRKQLEVICPKVVVLLGRVACLGVLERNISIVKEHGKTIRENNTTYVISYHPAAALRFVKKRIYFTEDFFHLKEIFSAL